MSTRITIREINLKPEANVEEFEKYVKEEASKFVWENGISHRFAKYHSGKKHCPYVLIFEATEEIYNLSPEEMKQLREERDKANPMNLTILDKLGSYIIDWEEGKGTITRYFSME